MLLRITFLLSDLSFVLGIQRFGYMFMCKPVSLFYLELVSFLDFWVNVSCHVISFYLLIFFLRRDLFFVLVLSFSSLDFSSLNILLITDLKSLFSKYSVWVSSGTVSVNCLFSWIWARLHLSMCLLSFC